MNDCFEKLVKKLAPQDQKAALSWGAGKPENERETLRKALAKICFRLEKKISEIKKRGLKNGNGRNGEK